MPQSRLCTLNGTAYSAVLHGLMSGLTRRCRALSLRLARMLRLCAHLRRRRSLRRVWRDPVLRHGSLHRPSLRGLTLHRLTLHGSLDAVLHGRGTSWSLSALTVLPYSVILIVHNINVFAAGKGFLSEGLCGVSAIYKDRNEEDKITNDSRGGKKDLGEIEISHIFLWRQIVRGNIFLGVFFIYSCRLTAEKDQENGKKTYEDYEEKLGASRGVEDLAHKGLSVQTVHIKKEMDDHRGYAGAAGVHYRKKEQSREEIDGEKCQPEVKHSKKDRCDDGSRADAEAFVFGAKDRAEEKLLAKGGQNGVSQNGHRQTVGTLVFDRVGVVE